MASQRSWLQLEGLFAENLLERSGSERRQDDVGARRGAAARAFGAPRPEKLAGSGEALSDVALGGRLAAATQDPSARKPRMSGDLFSPPFAGGGRPGPAAVHEQRPPTDDPAWFEHGNFYGRFFGWGDSPEGLPPLSPVDRAAYYHDREYFAIQDRYGVQQPSGPEDQQGAAVRLWFEPFSRFDKPQFTYELAIADLRMSESSLVNIAEGLDEGFYRGRPKYLLSDMVAGGLSYAFHSTLAYVRLSVYGVQMLVRSFGDLFSGKRNLGEFLQDIAAGLGQLAFGYAYSIMGTLRGAISLAVSAVKVVLRDPVKSAGGAAVGMLIGSVLGPVGTVVGGLVGAIVGGGGCFISTALLRATGAGDDAPELRLLRAFRDTYVRRLPGGPRELERYYRTAPAIVTAIEARPDADRIWRDVHLRFLVPAVAMIRSGQLERAHRVYRQMVDHCARLAGVLAASLGEKAAGLPAFGKV